MSRLILGSLFPLLGAASAGAQQPAPSAPPSAVVQGAAASSSVVATIARSAVDSALAMRSPQMEMRAGGDTVSSTPRDTLAQRLAPVLIEAEAIRRSGYAPAFSYSAMKTSTLLRDIPQAVTVIGPRAIADQGMRSMADVVRYTPGITMGQGEGHRDAPTIRGHSTTADFFVDGLRDDAQYYRDLYNVESVESLNGPNAMIFGRGGAGGVLNRVSKAADWQTVRRLELQGGSFEHRRVAADLGGALRRSFAGRANVMLEQGGSFRDYMSYERYGMSPTATLLAGRTILRLGYEHFSDGRTVDRGVPSFDGRPAAAPLARFFGDPDASKSRMRVDGATASVERELWSGARIRNTTRLATYDKYYGNVYPGATNAAGTEVNILAYRHWMERDNRFNQTDFTGKFSTGRIGHIILVGTEFGRQLTTNLRETGFFPDGKTTMLVPMSSPAVSSPVSYRNRTVDANNRSEAQVAAGYVQDQLSITGWLQAVAGIRYEKVSVRAVNRHAGAKIARDDELVSPRFGLILRPVDQVTVYGSHSVSHLPTAGDQLSSLAPSNRTLEPEKITNREIGIRWEPTSRLRLSGAAYQLDRTNTAAPDPGDASRLVQTGAQRTEGVELGLNGEVTSAWSVMAGFASQQALITATTSAAKEGATVPLVPRTTFSVWNRYQATQRIGAGFGVVHQSEMFAAIDNKVTLPGFTRVDAAFYLRIRDNLQGQVNVENLLDTRYYPTSHGNNNIMPGAPRTLRLTLVAGQ